MGQERTFQAVEVEQGLAGADYGLGLGDLAFDQVALGLGYQDGGRTPQPEFFLFQGEGFFP